MPVSEASDNHSTAAIPHATWARLHESADRRGPCHEHHSALLSTPTAPASSKGLLAKTYEDAWDNRRFSKKPTWHLWPAVRVQHCLTSDSTQGERALQAILQGHAQESHEELPHQVDDG